MYDIQSYDVGLQAPHKCFSGWHGKRGKQASNQPKDGVLIENASWLQNCTFHAQREVIALISHRDSSSVETIIVVCKSAGLVDPIWSTAVPACSLMSRHVLCRTPCCPQTWCTTWWAHVGTATSMADWATSAKDFRNSMCVRLGKQGFFRHARAEPWYGSTPGGCEWCVRTASSITGSSELRPVAVLYPSTTCVWAFLKQAEVLAHLPFHCRCCLGCSYIWYMIQSVCHYALWPSFWWDPCTASLFQTQRHRPRLSPTTKVWFPPHISRFTSIIATPSGCKRLTYGSKKVPRSSRNMQTLVSKVRFWNVWIFWIYQNLFRRIMNGPRPRSLDRLGADSNWLRREVYRTLIGSKSLMATWLKNHSQVLRPTAVCRRVCVCVSCIGL